MHRLCCFRHRGPCPAGRAGRPEARRILYSMYESGLTWDKPFKKSATCVGDVLGKYHPHGDASVYDALVRPGPGFLHALPAHRRTRQPLWLRGRRPPQPTVTRGPHGQNGRGYAGRHRRTPWIGPPTSTRAAKGPRSLPARFPNLLVNGSSGIAVGMATIPPITCGRSSTPLSVCWKTRRRIWPTSCSTSRARIFPPRASSWAGPVSRLRHRPGPGDHPRPHRV